MSNIYIQEPPTKGKVLLTTTFGEIDIELWSREAPKACRNFVQLCLERFYDGIIFHRVVKNFIAQTGDPTGTGCQSESIFGAPFKDEIHSRLRFVRRGLVALANNGKDDNGSQFFFTLEATPELQGKHTIFGKVAGDTQYNLIKLNEIMVDDDDRPVYATKIIKAEVLVNPFDDIVPRILNTLKPQEGSSKEKKKEKQGVKNYKLLSFGEEAEEDEIETLTEIKKYTGKSKSTHDVLNDPKLSSETIKNEERNDDDDDDDDGSDKETKEELFAQLENIKSKLNKKNTAEISKKSEKPLESDNYFASRREEEKDKKLEQIRNEMKTLKREYHKEKQTRAEEIETKKKKETDKSDVKKELEENNKKYLEIKKKIALKGSSRENFTLSLLENYKNTLKYTRTNKTDNTVKVETLEKLDKFSPQEWLGDQLHSDTSEVLAKDANTKSDDWYEIYDPRNPITKRRRETNKQQITEKIKTKYDLK